MPRPLFRMTEQMKVREQLVKICPTCLWCCSCRLMWSFSLANGIELAVVLSSPPPSPSGVVSQEATKVLISWVRRASHHNPASLSQKRWLCLKIKGSLSAVKINSLLYQCHQHIIISHTVISGLLCPDPRPSVLLNIFQVADVWNQWQKAVAHSCPSSP